MADLLEIRTRLVNEAGRFDLVTDAEGGDYSDAGGDDTINDAIAWLNEQRNDLSKILSTKSFALLSLDTDTNYWSDSHPHLLVNAARRMLEVRHRNTSGVNDWDTIILAEIHLIHANAVREDIDADIVADAEKRVMQG